ncbi:hypothetical protein [Deinococcus sp. YIM 77859]|uniref:hypothetical protein n=1 Tax=Deinococcus sp. YIM 77859 TaxID=1540221 RepID=UPI000552937B|nr:hypothetical protein [Deinococcus sp. YIM 77859]
MKKTLLGLLALSAVSSAAADAVGGYIGTDAGIYYRSELTADAAVRYGLNLSALNLFRGGSLALGGEVAYLRNASNQNFGGLNPYYGFGLGVNASLGSVTGVSAYPHVLGGLAYNVGGPLGVFVEGNIGPAIALSNAGSGIGLGAGVRLGVNYQLP